MLKNKIILSTFLLGSFMANASDNSELEEIGVYGEINYLSSDDELNRDNDFQNSFINVYAKYKTDDHIKLNVDIGAKNRMELMDLDSDEWTYNVNALNIEYHEYETNTFAVIGRQFTPIGINHDSPMKDNDLFATENPFSSVIDGLNMAYDSTIDGLDIKTNVFVGTRLDDVVITTSYGANVKVGNKLYGHINLGYMNSKIDGNFTLNTPEGSQIITDDLDLINIGYGYDNFGVKFLVDYNTLEHNESIEDIYQLKAKLGYEISDFTPYINYSSSAYYPENDLEYHTEMETYALGLEYKFPAFFTLGAEVGKEKFKYDITPDFEEDTVTVYSKFNF